MSTKLDKLDKDIKKPSTAKTDDVKTASSAREDDKDLSHKTKGTIPKDAGNPHLTTLLNIKNKLSEPKNREEFVNNVADLLAQFSTRKLTAPEKEALRNLVDEDLLNEVFKMKKQIK